MNTIYAKKQFKIYKVGKDRYIVHNSRKIFENGHTHIRSFKTAIYIINLAINTQVPKNNIGKYLLDSLIRISTDKVYIEKIKRVKHNLYQVWD